jgi:hypothetical protein
LFEHLEHQNQLIIEIGNYCNKLLKYTKGEERTINNSSNSIKNLGFELPYELQTSNFISYGNKNVLENTIRKNYNKNINKSFNEKSFSTMNLFSKESTKGSNTSREKMFIKPNFFTKKLMNKQYKIINNYHNQTFTKNKKEKIDDLNDDFFNI